MKTCPRCNESYPRTDYQNRMADKETGFVNIYSTCKTCIREKHMLKKYGITLDEYDAMLEKQNQVCKICLGPPGSKGRYYIDHNHTTGKIRGLLCSYCNFALGNSRDNIDILRNMIEYLEKDGKIL